MRYLQAALRPLWQAANALPESAPGDDFRLFLAGLVNQLHSYPISLSLILDDYQNIAHPEIHDGFELAAEPRAAVSASDYCQPQPARPWR
ncbi:hypothetical protein [Raoultella ornithinolytica]|uniref:hypothetical protein n=1 Tax=Raoultella ornithinolytica TaxID=54291 RepID=UPI00358FD48E